jgi:phosphoglycolate phosphatase-like HAD superfamily hydrolase
MIRHLIWDVDGVLFDTHPAVVYAISQSLNEMGHSVALNVVDSLARQSLDFCVDTLAARFKLDPALLRQRSAQHYRQIPPERQMPFPGVREISAWIVAHGGLNLITTARLLEATHALLAAHGMTALIAEVFSQEQNYPCKPDPAIVLAALEKYALAPAETLLIGHRESDIQAGLAAGMPTCLLGDAEVSSPPSLRIKDYHALLAYLSENQRPAS